MTPTPVPTPAFGPASDPSPLPMPALDPSSADWWWQYGLDGIVGGVLGGAVTAVAVVMTLRHERKSLREQELRLALARLHDLALGFVTKPWPPDPEERRAQKNWALLDVSRESANAIAVAGGQKKAARLIEELHEWDHSTRKELGRNRTDEAAEWDQIAIATALARRVADWLSALDAGGPEDPPLPGWPTKIAGTRDE